MTGMSWLRLALGVVAAVFFVVAGHLAMTAQDVLMGEGVHRLVRAAGWFAYAMAAGALLLAINTATSDRR